MTEILTNHGATHCSLSDSTKLRNITHLIAANADFPAYHDAVDAFIHVVTPSWVEQSVNKKKTPNPRQFSPDPRLFLLNVIVTFADDIPDGDKDAIVGGVTAMGGQYSPHLTKFVTHIVALTMDNHACKIIQEKNLKAKPVLPHWFDDCLKLGKKISHEPYLLPDPPILSAVTGEPERPIRYTSSAAISDAAHRDPPDIDQVSVPSSPSKERKELTVFRNKKVMFHKDLGLGNRLRKSLCDVVERGQGTTTTDVSDADMLICQYRNSAEYKSAGYAGIDIGNLGWLYYLIKNNIWTDPMRRLLHYPYPRDGVRGFKDFKIAVSLSLIHI